MDSRELRRVTGRAAEIIAEEAREKHRFISRTAMLERSVKTRVAEDGTKGIVFLDLSEAPYGAYVHNGTPPHVIRPKTVTMVPNKRRALRWVSGGQFVFAKSVQHPGYKGDPFLFDAMKSRSAEVLRLFDEYAAAMTVEAAKDMPGKDV